jgi:hypothetical protein
MKNLLRALFVALIALGLASQAIRAGRVNDDTEPMAALARRLASLGVETVATPSASVLIGRSKLCDQPVAVALSTIDGAEDESEPSPSGPDVEVRYVFLGSVGARPTRARLIGDWAWATIRFHAGLRPTKPSGRLVTVAWPRGCAGLAGLDWTTLSP